MAPQNSSAPGNSAAALAREAHRYQPYYCEENVWHLVGDLGSSLAQPVVLFITNRARTCLLWEQRAAPEGAPVLWDYHVILLDAQDPARVFDLDTTLGFPVEAERYLQVTFANAARWPAGFQPRFRWVPAERYRASFQTDRSHMVDDAGTYAASPPPWPPPAGGGTSLDRYLDLSDESTGEVLELAALKARLFGGGSSDKSARGALEKA